MKRFVLAMIAVGALSAPAMAANCAKDYKDFWDNFDRQKFKLSCLPSSSPISAARLYAAMMRARRVMSGLRPTTSSRSLIRWPTPKASDIFKDGAFGPAGSPNAKK